MRNSTQKIKVQNYSLTQMQESGWDVSDNAQDERDFYAKFANKNLMSQLTAKQRKVVVLLLEGRTRQEIADTLIVILQEVHQIIARIRRRIEDQEAFKQYVKSIKNLVWWIYYYKNCSAKQMYDSWHNDTIFNDYPRPSLGTLKKWIKGYQEE